MSVVRIVKPAAGKSFSKKQRRRHSIVALEMIRLDRAATEPLHQQLYRQVRDELVSGSFNDNSSRIPSSRALAADLGISRFTVNLALSRLQVIFIFSRKAIFSRELDRARSSPSRCQKLS